MRKLDDKEVARRASAAALYRTGRMTLDEAARKVGIRPFTLKGFIVKYGGPVKERCTQLFGHVCSSCGVGFYSRRSFVWHLIRVHKSVPSTCVDCNVLLTKENRANIKMYQCKVCRKNRSNKETKNAKLDVMDHYGNRCACCGESTFKFLTIDHVNDDGGEHRKELGIPAGNRFYRWLRRSGYPSGFQILCWNCQEAKNLYGECPHNSAISELADRDLSLQGCTV